jgi:hypothetical protein
MIPSCAASRSSRTTDSDPRIIRSRGPTPGRQTALDRVALRRHSSRPQAGRPMPHSGDAIHCDRPDRPRRHLATQREAMGFPGGPSCCGQFHLRGRGRRRRPQGRPRHSSSRARRPAASHRYMACVREQAVRVRPSEPTGGQGHPRGPQVPNPADRLRRSRTRRRRDPYSGSSLTRRSGKLGGRLRMVRLADAVRST